MGFRNPGSAGFPDRSNRSRPLAFPSFLTLFTCAGCVPPHFSATSGGNEGGGEDASSVKALLATSKDNLQTPSSRASSSSMEPNSALGADRNNALTENNMYHRTLHVENLQYPSSRYSSSSMGVASSSENDPAVKGKLGFINTIAEKMFLFYFGLLTFSLTYPLGQKAGRSFNDPWVQFIITGNFISAFLSLIMAAFASHFKESVSIDRIGFRIFIWLVFLELVAFILECCITLHIFGLVSYRVAVPFGIAGVCFTALTWIFYFEQPKFLNKWANNMWRKMKSYPRTPGGPRPQI